MTFGETFMSGNTAGKFISGQVASLCSVCLSLKLVKFMEDI